MEKNLTIFTYDVPEFLRTVAKKGSESDITLHNRKEGDNVFTFLVPSRFPEKVSSLTDSIFPADLAIVNGDNVNKEFGEVVVALDLMGLKHGYFLVSDESKTDAIKRITSGTGLRNFDFFTGNPMELMPLLEKENPAPRFGHPTVLVDHFFNVKSVGTVALGFVLGGKIEKHQKLMCSYADKEVQVRSIQVQDIDREEAGSGTRVGLALKNIDSEELERGMFLSDHEFQYLDAFNGTLEISPFAKIKEDEVQEIFVSDLMRHQRGEYGHGKVSLEHKVVRMKENLVVSTPNRSPRVFGRIRIS